MTGIQDYHDLIGRTAVDVDGDKIGTIAQIYVDDASDEPRWVTISTGLFGTKESFAPLHGSHREGDDLQLAVQKARVKDAPNVDADGQLDVSDNQALYSHYAGATTNPDTVGHDQLAGDVAAISPRTNDARLRKYSDTDRNATGHSDR